MNEAVPDCLVTDFEEEIDALTLPDPDDRHVLAAAIRGGVDILVTFNLADFPDETLVGFGIEAMHPDDFLVSLLDLAFERFCSAVRSQREGLRHPPKTAEELLTTFEAQGLPRTVAHLRSLAADL